MKKIMTTIFVSMLINALMLAQNATNQPAAEKKQEALAQFKWADGTIHDFGKIEKGKPVTYTFKFTNTGQAPLILTEVHPSCGCTAADYSKEPVAVGKEGYIKVTFSAASPGIFTKSITVKANIEGGSTVLTIKGEVVEMAAK
jgi:hypothetical protein